MIENIDINTVTGVNEDLTVQENILKFKDRDYEPNIYSGKGYKILRIKNENCNTGNCLIQADIMDDNTVYEVRYDFDLQGETIIMPKSSVLQFKGGSIKNGTIQGDSTLIAGYNTGKFIDVELTGTFLLDAQYVTWEEIDGDNNAYACYKKEDGTLVKLMDLTNGTLQEILSIDHKDSGYQAYNTDEEYRTPLWYDKDDDTWRYADGLIGEMVFNDEFVFSMYGKNSSDGTTNSYDEFKKSDPMNTSNSFRPNYLLNCETGEVWLGAGSSYFNDDGSGSLANGNITWDTEGNITIKGSLTQDCANTIKSKQYNFGSATITLANETASHFYFAGPTAERQSMTMNTITINIANCGGREFELSMGPASLNAINTRSLYALASQCLKIKITGGISDYTIDPWHLPVVLSPNHTLKFRVQGSSVVLLYPSIPPVIGNLSVNVVLSGTNPLNVVTYFVTPFFDISSTDTYNTYLPYAAGNMIRAWTCNSSKAITGLSYSLAYKALAVNSISVMEQTANYSSTSTSYTTNWAVSLVPDIVDGTFGSVLHTTDCLYSLHIGYRYTGNTSSFIYSLN